MAQRRSPGRPAFAAAIVWAVMTAASAWRVAPGPAAASPLHAKPVAASRQTGVITVGQFNCDISDEYPRISVAKVASAIRRSGADVVGIEEGGASIPEIAHDLGWAYFDVRMQIVSRLPLIDPPDGNGRYTFVQVQPGRVVAMENVHLPSSPYGPYWARDGVSKQDILALERRLRLAAILPDLRIARSLERRGIPVFLTGDFNSPSFLDWTREAARSGVHPYALRWPASAAVVKAGFVDSYRAVYPNPIANPGLTWPVHRTLGHVWNPNQRTPKDRIDFVYAAGNATATASRIVGERGDPEASATVQPWPSDHRLVASTFTVAAAEAPTLVTVPQRLVTAGDPVPVTYHADGGDARRLAIVPAGGDPATDAVARRNVRPGQTADGTLTFSSASWAPGAYEAVLMDTSLAVRSRFPFWVQAPGAVPVMSTSKRTYGVGESIGIGWHDAPGNRWDWIGVYHRRADVNHGSYLLWTYTGSTIDGSASLDKYAHGAWPLPPGRYVAYLLKDDLYVPIASARFRVRN